MAAEGQDWRTIATALVYPFPCEARRAATEWALQQGLPFPPAPLPKPAPIDHALVAELIHVGLTDEDIATAVGSRSVGIIRAIRRELGRFAYNR